MAQIDIVEFIKKIGSENIMFQMLPTAMTNISTNAKGVSKVTFETDGLSATEVALGSAKHLGMVLWLPVEMVEKAKTELGL